MHRREKSISLVVAIVGVALCVSLCGLLTGADQWSERSGQNNNLTRSARLNRASIAQPQLSGPVFLLGSVVLSASVNLPIPASTHAFRQVRLEGLLVPRSLGCVTDRAPPVS
jgi:hypothetical protein